MPRKLLSKTAFLSGHCARRGKNPGVRSQESEFPTDLEHGSEFGMSFLNCVPQRPLREALFFPLTTSYSGLCATQCQRLQHIHKCLIPKDFASNPWKSVPW